MSQIDKSYPRKIGNWWLGCPQEKLGQLGDGTLTGGRAQQSGSQMDGRDRVTNMAGARSVASDNVDQFINVDASTTAHPGSDTLGNGSVRVGACGLTSVVLISTLLQHLLCR